MGYILNGHVVLSLSKSSRPWLALQMAPHSYLASAPCLRRCHLENLFTGHSMRRLAAAPLRRIFQFGNDHKSLRCGRIFSCQRLQGTDRLRDPCSVGIRPQDRQETGAVRKALWIMIWATSIWKLGCSNHSRIPSAQNCYLCLRYVESPMSPGRTAAEWRRVRDSNPRYPSGYAGFQDRCHQPLGQLSGYYSFTTLPNMCVHPY